MATATRSALSRAGGMRLDRLRSPHAVFWSVFALSAVVGFARNAYLFTTPIHEAGDAALNSLLVQNAEHGHQLVGNYSRVGFHHPGPALVYMLAAGQALFHGLLHVAPTPYNGQALGTVLYVAAFIALTALCIYRQRRSLSAAALTTGVLLVFAANHPMFGSAWFPYLYISPFLLLVAAGAALAAGRTVELPSYVFAGSVLIHGHVSFFEFVGVTSVVAGLGWLRVHRADRQRELAEHRRGVIGSAAIVGVSLVPIVAELALHFPGPWPSYWHYVRQGVPSHQARDVVAFFLWFIVGNRWVADLTIIALAIMAVLLRTGRREIAEREFRMLYLMVGVQTALLFLYVARGVDMLLPINFYVGYFYLGVPVLLMCTVLVHAHSRLHGALRQKGPAVLAGALLVAACASPIHELTATTPGNYQQIAAALKNYPARDGRPVEFRFVHDEWPRVAGIGLAASRAAVRWCVADPTWTNLFTSAYVCHGAQQRLDVVVAAPSGATIGAGNWQTIWQDADVVLLTAAAQRAG